MKCAVCGSDKIIKTYEGIIRDGGLGKYTKNDVTMWKCMDCDVIWHGKTQDNESYYESEEYRNTLDGDSDIKTFYSKYDEESEDKFRYTGTSIFRDKIVADIGCGAGAFLDYVYNVAKKVIAIEPSKLFREEMEKKGFVTYPYARNALDAGMGGAVDIIVSFDVIEHVEDPISFLVEANELLEENGTAIIGTPTDAPLMREIIGQNYEQRQLFSTQHLWVFGEKNLKIMAKNAGFEKIDIRFYQRYGFDNFLGWVRDKKPRSEVHSDKITRSFDAAWRGMLEDIGASDYVVAYLKK